MVKIKNLITDSDIKELFEEFTKTHQEELNKDFPPTTIISYVCDCGEYTPMRAFYPNKEVLVCVRALNQLNFNKGELFACIAHELGHLRTPLNGKIGNVNREKEADEYACYLGYKNELMSVINKFLTMEDGCEFPNQVLKERLLHIQTQ